MEEERRRLFQVEEDDEAEGVFSDSVTKEQSSLFQRYGTADNSSSKKQQDEDEYTFEEAVEHFGFGRFQLRLGFSVGLVIMADAAQLLAPTILGTLLQCSSWKLSQVKVAWLTTIVFVGMIALSPFVGYIVDKIGRKLGILLTLVFGTIFAALGSFSPSYPWLLVSRFLVGAALAGSLQVFGYIEEFLPVAHRRRAMLVQLFWPIGGLWASGFALLVIYHFHLSWNWYMLIMSVPLFLTVLFVTCLPESARFLGAMGKFHKVHRVLHKIGKENQTGLPAGRFSHNSLSNLRTDEDEDKDDSSGNFVMLFQKENLKTTLLLSFVWFGSGFVYYGIIFLVTLFNTKNVSDKLCVPLTITDYTDLMWTGFAEIPGTLVTFYLLEKVGRKMTLISQFIVVLLSLIPFFFTIPYYASLISLLIGRAVAQGIISALVIYTPEVYPTNLRGRGIGVANLFFRTGGMLTPFFSQVTAHSHFSLTIAVYLAVCAVSAICAFFLPKETQGRELEN
eukprot:gene512-1159_t